MPGATESCSDFCYAAIAFKAPEQVVGIASGIVSDKTLTIFYFYLSRSCWDLGLETQILSRLERWGRKRGARKVRWLGTGPAERMLALCWGYRLRGSICVKSLKASAVTILEDYLSPTVGPGGIFIMSRELKLPDSLSAADGLAFDGALSFGEVLFGGDDSPAGDDSPGGGVPPGGDGSPGGEGLSFRTVLLGDKGFLGGDSSLGSRFLFENDDPPKGKFFAKRKLSPKSKVVLGGKFSPAGGAPPGGDDSPAGKGSAQLLSPEVVAAMKQGKCRPVVYYAVTAWTATQEVGNAKGVVSCDMLLICSLRVSEGHRGRGLGTELLGRLEDLGRTLGATKAWQHSSAASREFALKRGYSLDGQLWGKPLGAGSSQSFSGARRESREGIVFQCLRLLGFVPS